MTIRAVGDALPPVVATYYDLVDGDDPAAAAGCFTTDGVYATPPVGEVETAPREVTVGRSPLRDRLDARGRRAWRHVPVLTVVDGPDVLLEGVLHDAADRPISTFVASVRLAADGLIARYLAFACAGTRDAPPADVAVTSRPADAAAVVHDYFAALDDGRFADAAARFSTDVLYSHPPYRHTGIDDPDRIEFRGRPALAAACDARGRASFDHELLTLIQRGPHCLFEGVVNNLPHGGTGSFVSSLSLGADGTIRRYVSFYCEPGVP